MARDSEIRSFAILIFVLSAIIFSMPSAVMAAAMNDYCQVPPVVTGALSPNVMLDVDVSLSMGFAAYQQASNRQRFCSGNTNIECDPHHDSGGTNTDCTRNWGVCQGTGHERHCSLNSNRDCRRDTDCTRNWGSCSSTATSLSYGTCSNDETKGCTVDNVATVCGLGATCDALKTYEGYFTPDKDYLAGFCSNDTTIGCDANSDCGTGTCMFVSGYCSSSGNACSYPGDTASCTGSGNTCRPTYYEFVRTGSTCSVQYTYPCSANTNNCSGATTTKPANALNTCPANQKYYCANRPGQPSMISGDCGTPSSGNWLNYVNMARIDLLRWAMTGGSPATCTPANSGSTGGANFCDPRMYPTTSGKIDTVCKSNLQLDSLGTTGKGCILKSNGASSGGGSSSATSVSVAVPWQRIMEGLTFQFDQLPVKPRMGAYFFPGSTDYVKSNYVYIGDFTSAASRASFNYQNLITEVNATPPDSYTPTGPSMWDILNYFKQDVDSYGGIDASSASNWKSPMYDCPDKGGANCRYIPCAKNFVLLMSDGLWNQPSCDIGDTGSDPVIPAYNMHKGFTNLQTNVATKVAAVYTVGMFVGEYGAKALENIAMYGSFDYNATTQPYPGNTGGFPSASCNPTDSGSGCSTATGSSCTNLPPSSTDWDKNVDSVPDTYFVADDALTIRTNIMNAVLDMLAKVTSGTAASVLASGEGSGANIAQAIYYPRRSFFSGAVDWTGGLQNFWYYVDPKFVNSNIREEGGTARDYVLDILADGTSDSKKDYLLKFEYDVNAKKTYAKRFYGLANGGAGAQIDTVEFESLGNLWEAGKLLWARDPSTRIIYTPLTTTYPITFYSDPAVTANKFITANLSTLRPLLNTDASAAAEPTRTTENNALATNVIDWVRGTDFAEGYEQTYTTGAETYRRRTVSLTDTSGTGVWKLGDIIDSTPRISSWVPLHYYDTTYHDNTYTNFVSSSQYINRGMIYVGANDGMLHAFKLGKLGLTWRSRTNTQKATLKYCSGNPETACAQNSDCGAGGTCTTDTDLGEEKWAFIPRSVLPYLKYIKENDYCHLYTVDLTPYLFDASVGVPAGCSGDYWTCSKSASTWRTVLIGGMRYGGACRATTTVCTDVNGDGQKDCVNTPLDISGVSGSSPLGYSSYFALDVTDPENPKLMWEFTNDNLGFATSGPTIVRINSRTVSGSTSSPPGPSATNGRWFVVLGSGPTGPIDTSEHQFMGRSDQNLRLFILDLANGSLLRTIDTGIANAFSGSIINATHDSDFAGTGMTPDYQDNAIYIGYTKKVSAGTTWTDGGILRILTREDLDGSNITGSGACTAASTALNPNCWVFGRVMDGIGPVTSSIVRLQQIDGDLWFFTGTGRYFFKTSAASDDGSGQRHLIGVKDPCFEAGKYKEECMDTADTTVALEPSGTVLGLGDLTPVDLTTVNGVSATKGWVIALDAADSTAESDAERVITDPLASVAGIVYFTTFKPYDTVCKAGGTTALWAVKYDTAAAAGALLKGKALIQVSTGEIRQLDLRDAFTERGERKSTEMEGAPPTAQGLSLISAPPPVKKVLHMRER